jgi:hypothetical protein
MEGQLDPLQVLGLPTTRSRAKNIKEGMEGLVRSTWTRNLSEGIGKMLKNAHDLRKHA